MKQNCKEPESLIGAQHIRQHIIIGGLPARRLGFSINSFGNPAKDAHSRAA